MGAAGFVFVRTWGGGNVDRGYGVAVDPSGNLLVAGYTASFGSGAFLLKYTPLGGLTWQKIWTGNTGTQGQAVATDSVGAAYVTGVGGSGLMIAKVGSSGSASWQRTWANLSTGNAIAIDSLGYCYVTGLSNRYNDPFLVKLSPSGATVWEKLWGVNTTHQSGYGVAVDSTGAIYVAGSIYVAGLQSSASLLLKYNSTGSLQWKRSWSFRNTDGNVSIATSVAVGPLGEVFVAGSVGGGDTGNAAITKFASNGSLLWQRMWPSVPEGFSGGVAGATAHGVAADNSGDVYVTGEDNGNAFLLKIDTNGSMVSASEWRNGVYGYGIALDHLGNPAIVGLIYGAPSTKGKLTADQNLANQNPTVITPVGASMNASDASVDPGITIADANGSTSYAGSGDVFLNYGTTFPVPAFTPVEIMSLSGLILIAAKKGKVGCRGIRHPAQRDYSKPEGFHT